MALQTSGAISLLDIQNEFGGSNPISLSEYYGVAAGIPSSGAISVNQFYGASAGMSYTIAQGPSNLSQSIFEPWTGNAFGSQNMGFGVGTIRIDFSIPAGRQVNYVLNFTNPDEEYQQADYARVYVNGSMIENFNFTAQAGNNHLQSTNNGSPITGATTISFELYMGYVYSQSTIQFQIALLPFATSGDSINIFPRFFSSVQPHAVSYSAYTQIAYYDDASTYLTYNFIEPAPYLRVRSIVSSEACCDKGNLSVNGVGIFNLGGQVFRSDNFSNVTTMTMGYYKDSSVSEGSDAANFLVEITDQGPLP